MRPSRLGFPIALTVAALLLHSPARAQWADNGVNVCAAPWAQSVPITLADGSGGVFIVWTDARTGNGSTSGWRDLFASHLDAGGVRVGGWPADGLVVCDAPGDQVAPAVASDESGGLYIAWQDHRSIDYDLYVTHIDGDGTLHEGWDPNGNQYASGAADQQSPCLCSDGLTGVFVAWSDSRDGTFDIRALHLARDGSVTPAPQEAGALQSPASPQGNVICNAAGDQTVPVLVFDGADRALVIWQDGRGANSDIYGARIQWNGSADATWTSNGVLVSNSASGNDQRMRAVSDDAQGAIVSWYSSDQQAVWVQRLARQGRTEWAATGVSAGFGTANSPIPLARDGAGGVYVATESDPLFYVQHLSGSGAIVPGWPTGGFKIQTATTPNVNAMLEDGSGGTYAGYTVGGDVYLQHLTSGGAVVIGWPAAGAPICAVPSFSASLPAMVADGAGGALVAWQDSRPGPTQLGQPRDDIYAQRVLPMGLSALYTGALTSALDVPADQGGWVSLNVQAPPADVQALVPGVTGYNVWRLVTGAQASAYGSDGVAGGRELVERAKREPVLLRAAQAASAGFPAGTWQSLGFNAALQNPGYALLAPTRNDSTASGLATETYVVTIHTTSSAQYTVTVPLSAHSTDNLAPAMPLNLSGALAQPGVVNLAWNPNAEGDLAGYAVYRGPTSGFVPAPGNRVGTPTLPAYHDAGFTTGSWYKVTAVDRHGNESSVALLGSTQIAGVPPDAGEVDFLARPAPDPFAQGTTVRFGLARAGRVSLTVHDVAGRRVRTLVAGARPAGHFSVAWRGDDDAGRELAPGVYLVRLRADGVNIVRRVARVE